MSQDVCADNPTAAKSLIVTATAVAGVKTFFATNVSTYESLHLAYI